MIRGVARLPLNGNFQSIRKKSPIVVMVQLMRNNRMFISINVVYIIEYT
jgi:hypothetical protein